MSTAAPPPSRSRPRRVFVIVSLVLLAALLAGVAAAVAARTALVEAALRTWLAGQGVAPVELRITGLGWRAARVEGLRLTDQLTVERLDVAYRLAGVMKGQVDGIDIAGVRLDVTDLDGGLVGVLRRKLAATPEAAGAEAGALPAIALSDVQAHVRLAGVDATAVLAGAVRPDGTVRIDLSAARVTAPGVAALRLSGHADYDGARATANLDVRVAERPERIGLSAAFDAAARRAQVTLDKTAFAPDGLQPGDIAPDLLTLGPLSATLDGAATVMLTPAGPDIQARIDVADLAVTHGDVTLEDGAAAFAIAWLPGAPEVSVHVTNGQAAVTAQGQRAQLEAADVQARFDLATRAVQATLEGARLSHPWLAPLRISGEAALENGAVTFAVRAGDGVLDVLGVQGTHDLATGHGGAEVRAGPWRFAPGGRQPRDLSPLLDTVQDAQGTVGARAALTWKDGDVDGTARLTVDELSFTLGALRAEGMSGDVAFAELTPPHMAAAQTVRARRLDGGVAGLDAPRLTFRLDRDGTLAIGHGEGRIAGGLIALDGQAINVRRPSNAITLTLARLDLAELFGLLNLEGISGQGRLSGEVPFTVSAETVTIADGHLAAEGPGVLRLRSGAARQALGGAGVDVALLLDVLEDFNYQSLDLRIAKDSGGEATVRLSTAGSNPAVMDGQPFNINVNLTTRLDKVLATLGAAMRLSQQALRDTVESLSGTGR